MRFAQADGDRGEVSSEAVILVPVLIGLVVVTMQFATWYHRATIARATAWKAVAEAGLLDARAEDGERAGWLLLEDLGAHDGSAIEVTRSPTTVHAEVAVAVPRLLPGFPGVVRREARATVERFVGEAER